MKKIIAIGFGSGACVLAIIGMTSWLTPSDKDRHCPPPDTRCQSSDPNCPPPKNTDDCNSDSSHGGGAYRHATTAEDDESAGHAGFGESAGAHGGSGGE